jgi:hypothetical protein
MQLAVAAIGPRAACCAAAAAAAVRKAGNAHAVRQWRHMVLGSTRTCTRSKSRKAAALAPCVVAALRLGRVRAIRRPAAARAAIAVAAAAAPRAAAAARARVCSSCTRAWTSQQSHDGVTHTSAPHEHAAPCLLGRRPRAVRARRTWWPARTQHRSPWRAVTQHAQHRRRRAHACVSRQAQAREHRTALQHGNAACAARERPCAHLLALEVGGDAAAEVRHAQQRPARARAERGESSCQKQNSGHRTSMGTHAPGLSNSMAMSESTDSQNATMTCCACVVARCVASSALNSA